MNPTHRKAADRHYWLTVFSGATWQQFVQAGGNVTGYRERARRIAERIECGDYLLCYLRGVSRFIGVLEAQSRLFSDTSPIWTDEAFPCRLQVEIVAALTPETAVPILSLSDKLAFFQTIRTPNAWTGYVRQSPTEWQPADGEAVVDAVLAAKKKPVVREVDAKKLK